ncbi:solute carrier organic anion transporter family member 1B2 [Caerostris extrusa]|uniref:Solute carrier organic anion transporter family member 1B2 n=1 Tax=Caerostris extrusa TaxID=172846 RepID=A0AAV4MHP1_CAEEX|nr:solute carrier organic anion transporter family member 1B2 [Caerostris extrusa]
MISTIIGGYLIWRFKPSAKFLTAGIFTLEIVSATGYLLLMIPRCQTVEMANYGSNSQGLILESACNVNCNCSKSAFTPVCGPDGKTLFFSPCYAGCGQKANESYTDCSCVFDSTGQERNYVTEGPCVNEHCWSQALAYIITMPFIQLIVSLLRVATERSMKRYVLLCPLIRKLIKVF